ncbi:MAG: competence/damage-inducible protein A [Hyphomonadaceae bacterium]
MAQDKKRVRAAVLLIGDELLSGRTQDVNLQAIAKFLAPLGVQVAEARICGDEIEEIAENLNALRARYDYVLTTGGIGPTHDDKTADAVAHAFGVGIDIHPDARKILETHYKSGPLNEARLRMARIPDGGVLIDNPVSRAPGFKVGNVFVMAGVPSIMRGMLLGVGPHLEGGEIVRSRIIRGKGLREGDLAAGLEALDQKYEDVSFGSYPWFSANGHGAHLVARSSSIEALEAACADLFALVESLGVEPELVDEAS